MRVWVGERAVRSIGMWEVSERLKWWGKGMAVVHLYFLVGLYLFSHGCPDQESGYTDTYHPRR